MAIAEYLPNGDTPLVSVILPTRNRPRLLGLALRYYQYQKYPNKELIVVDDGDVFPADARAVEECSGRLIRVPPNTPLGTKLNEGAQAARGSICQKMDDDDWYSPEFLEKMVAGFLEKQSVVCRPTLAFLMPFLFFEVGRWEIRQSVSNNVPGATLMFGRDVWEQRPFRPLFETEDVWFFVDQLRAGTTTTPVNASNCFLAVRHRGLGQDRGHAWTVQHDGKLLEDSLKELKLDPRSPEDMLPAFALDVYRELKQGMRGPLAALAGT